MSNITFSEKAWEDYLYWQSHDKQMLKKVNSLLKTIQRSPFIGEGKPEPLKGIPNAWSRRINEKDRLVYRIENNVIYIDQCKGHYTDK